MLDIKMIVFRTIPSGAIVYNAFCYIRIPISEFIGWYKSAVKSIPICSIGLAASDVAIKVDKTDTCETGYDKIITHRQNGLKIHQPASDAFIIGPQLYWFVTRSFGRTLV